MLELRTVDPDRVRVIDGDREGCAGRSGRGIDKARVEPAGCGAGRVEGALDDVVVAGVEVEGYGVARGGCGAVGRVGKAVVTDLDVVVCGGDGGDEGEESEEIGGRMHRGMRCSVEWDGEMLFYK